MNTATCNNATLENYTPLASMPWNLQRAQHLFRRLGFGANHATLLAALQTSPNNLIETLISNAQNLPITTAPDWADNNLFSYQGNDNFDFALFFQHALALKRTWVAEMFEPQKAFREKLALFWSNHFVSIFDSYQCTPALYQYHKLLQENALKNFKEFTLKMGLNPAMLLFLNGNTNIAQDTNENYARELFELFTLGVNNGYTQTDIEEAARALTGWKSLNCVDVFFVANDFDAGEKTIFGQTGNWNYHDLIDILFEQRPNEIARFICEKLYKFYVSQAINEEVIQQLANTFIANNWEIAPVLKQLFTSKHFFDAAAIGNNIKSPTELLIGFVNNLGYQLNSNEDFENAPYFLDYMGQNVFNPPDVAGWQGNRTWVNNNSLTNRWEIAALIIYYIYNNNLELFRNLAKNISSSSNDASIISQEIADYFLPNGLNEPEDYATILTVFKGEVPENYFTNGTWNLDFEYAPQQVALLIFHLIKQPEFQLC